jgi:hypothetical protein
MHNLYHSGQIIIGPDYPDYELALEGERDMQLLAFAFDQLVQTEPSDTYRELLKKLISDSVLPQRDRNNSPGRDAGFEIYVGGVCAAAKLLPIAWEEPDITCFLGTAKHGFAAKRLKSINKIYDRVSKAADQINRVGLPGVIVLDLALAFNPENRRLAQMHETVFWSEYMTNFRATWSEYQEKVQTIVAGSEVLGMVVHDYHIRQQSEGWQLAGMTIRVPNGTRSINDQRYFDKLSTIYTYGLPNQSDVECQALHLP